MRIRRLGCLIICMLLFVLPAAALDPPVPEQIYGSQALLYCVESGQTLFEKNADTAALPASLTKLMTALIVLEHEPDLTRQTTVSQTAVQVESDSTRIGLIPGEVVTLHDMIYGTLMYSANDAANVLAEYVGQTQQGFAAMMNARAAELGCKSTHFQNAHGLDAGQHYTSARDIALIMEALLQHPRFLEISRAPAYTMPPTNKYNQQRIFKTKQQMRMPDSEFFNPAVIASKNGYTSKAHHTQAVAARKDGMTWIAVSMGASEDRMDAWRDMRTLIDYGLEQFHAVTLTPYQVADMATRVLGQRVLPSACEELTVVLPLDADTEKLSLSRKPDGSYVVMLRYEGEDMTVGQAGNGWQTQTVEPVASTEEKPIESEPNGFQLWLTSTVSSAFLRLLPWLVGAFGVAFTIFIVRYILRRRREEQEFDYLLGMRTYKKKRKRRYW